jgi:hypothetical protein
LLAECGRATFAADSTTSPLLCTAFATAVGECRDGRHAVASPQASQDAWVRCQLPLLFKVVFSLDASFAPDPDDESRIQQISTRILGSKSVG